MVKEKGVGKKKLDYRTLNRLLSNASLLERKKIGAQFNSHAINTLSLKMRVVVLC